ncbi:MAG: hypothetical protein Q4B90_06730 [Eubacteriales bacterium]|nr:hypothetical protein [Eubacteriales bacterium]
MDNSTDRSSIHSILRGRLRSGIDTPLYGFDENDTELPDSMKDGLFKYFVHHLTRQLIIVENTDHVPSNIDFEALGANVITFTKKRDEGLDCDFADIMQVIPDEEPGEKEV